MSIFYLMLKNFTGKIFIGIIKYVSSDICSRKYLYLRKQKHVFQLFFKHTFIIHSSMLITLIIQIYRIQQSHVIV